MEKAIRKLWRGDECEVLRCSGCGFGFGYPFVGGDEEFYSILHEQKGYPAWRWDYDFAIRDALSAFGSGKVLDVGAGTGSFLCGLAREWECSAVESSESNRKDLEERGIRVFRDLPDAASVESGRFDAVTMFQVLEHIADFWPLLKSCRELLAVGGKIVITVPDGDAMIRQEKLTGCADMPPNHINKWTPNSLKRVLEESGFVVEKTVFEPSRLKCFAGALHMRVLTDATEPGSMAAQFYRIQNKRLRAPLVACLGLPALFRMLPYAIQLMQGGAFGVVAKTRQG